MIENKKYLYELLTYRCGKCGRIFKLFVPKFHYANDGTGRCNGKLVKGKLVWVEE